MDRAAPGAEVAPAGGAPPRTTSISVDAAGVAVLVMAAGGLAAGLLLGWTELLVIGVVAGLVALGAAAFLLGRSELEVSVAVLEGRVVAGTPATALVRVRNVSRRARRPGVAEVALGARVQSVAVPRLAAGEQAELRVALPAARRGVLVVGPVTVVRRDPLGLARREIVRSETTSLYVHPATVDLPVEAPGLLRDLEGVATGDPADSDMSFQALRAYLPGDDRRHIHWKSTAKTGAFLVRQFEQTRRSHVIVLQSTSPVDYDSPEEFELGVSVAASIAARLLRDRTAVSVYAGHPGLSGHSGQRVGRSPDVAGASRAGATTSRAAQRTNGLLRSHARIPLLDDLSGVQPEPGTAGVVTAARRVAETVGDVSSLFLVAGSTVTARQWRAAAAHLPRGVEVVAVVARPESTPTLVRIDSVRITRIGYLDDLGRALGRAAGL
ncbi:DUF58 domain-containing protein [Herbiconiux sp. KACC 21604]|uniref:DUF58 domain-containing protein n=1 Tax=unclassified Herbiconiux TaxID=2618217 RepID=UPI0014930D18|nr:DUF58 domain-containing protein [Herbiconiux sp. SALV-R1]QJU53249.1 DUF58 domain-containing protein [Herbiconiux sp. SALV-R1]WPO88208.1 DUF58 domain-containing protein [Herbiconiux sp. KACC 21604]